MYIYFIKAKFASFKKKRPSEKNGKNVHGNVIKKADLSLQLKIRSYKFKLTILSIILTIEPINLVSHGNI